MPTEIAPTSELNNNSENQRLSLRRVRVEEAKSNNHESILGMDFPSGILISD